MTEDAKLFVIRALRPPIYGETVHDLGERLREAAKLIESMSAELEQVKRERDAAVEDIPRVCEYCKHYLGYQSYVNCEQECINIGGINTGWQWRGVKEE